MRTFMLCILCTITNLAVAQENYEYRYWFDSYDKSAQMKESGGNLFRFEADASLLPTGLHTFNYQITNSQNGISTVKTSLFYKTPSFFNKNSIVLIDGVPNKQYDITGTPSSITHIDIDADTLDIGVHTLGILLIDDAGVASSVSQSFFIKVPTNTDLEDMNIYYFIDEAIKGKTKCSIVGGIAHAQLDMSTLADGLHSISFMLGNSTGITTQVKTSYFVKDSNGTITSITEIPTDETSNRA